MLRCSIVAAGLVLAGAPAFASDITGTWTRSDGSTRVRIAPCGSSLCATNIWVRDPSGGEKVGDRLVMTLSRQSDGTMSGRAHDVRRDLNLSMTIRTTGNGFTSSGCVLGGVICKQVAWTK